MFDRINSDMQLDVDQFEDLSLCHHTVIKKWYKEGKVFLRDGSYDTEHRTSIWYGFFHFQLWE